MWVGRSFPRRRVDEDGIDFLRVHYDTDSPGLGQVVEVHDDGMIIKLWGHLFRTTELATAPHLRPLSRVERFLAPQRLGEFILRHEVRAGQVIMAPPRSRPKQRLVRFWLHRTRGDLPILAALGGRIRLPFQRRLKSRLFHWLGRLGIMPAPSGFLDHGVLIDRIGITVSLTYAERNRSLWLDRILLHKNHSLHLIGIDLDNHEQRTFRLDRVTAMAIPPLGPVETDSLHWELQALCMSRKGWLWYWNRHQSRLGRPPASRTGPIGRGLLPLSKAASAVRSAFGNLAGAVRAWRQARDDNAHARPPLSAETTQRPRTVEAASEVVHRPPGRKPPRRAAAKTGMPSWRRRLLRAIDTVEAGGREQITCLLPMNALLADAERCHAYLRYLMEATLAEAKVDPHGHPLAPQLLAEALAMAPPLPRPIPRIERQAASVLIKRFRDVQPGYKRISIHATRRAGADARLLLGERYLAAVYRIWGWDDPWGDARWDEAATRAPDQLGFYLTSAHFIARWDKLRYRVDSTSVPRLRMIIDWWDVSLSTLTPPIRGP